MADQEKKLGPNVTYTNPDQGAKMTTVAGVLLKEGQAVNLEEKLGKDKAAPILKKLSKNRYFKVDGGEDHSKEEQSQAPSPNEAQSAWAVQEEARIRSAEGDEAADKFVQSLDDDGNVKAEGEEQQKSAAARKAEQNYKAPPEPQLEQPIPKPKRPQTE